MHWGSAVLRITALAALWLGLVGFASAAAPILPASTLTWPPPLMDLAPPEEPPSAEAAADAESEAEAAPAEPVLPSPWERVPPVRVFPRMGMFLVPPRDPGYYSLLDLLKHHSRPGPPNFPYPPFSIIAFSFFDADFRYLDRPGNTQHDLFDPIKRMKLGDDCLLSLGGEIRYRYANEHNARLQATANGPNGVPVQQTTANDYSLLRTRLFADLWYQDKLRAYVEFYDARIWGNELPPLLIDDNPAELLNAFIDLKWADIANRGAYLRVGRQELLYGSQRLISPLDWANIRRTYQGVKVFRPGDKIDVDLWWVQPVLPDPDRCDSVDNDVNFAGAWFTYRPRRGTFVDLYYLFLDNVTPLPPPSPPAPKGTRAPPFNVSTLGARYAGDYDGRFLWDFEAMWQFGERGQQDICAAAASAGLGYHWATVPMHPQAWIYYDYASGDRHPGQGKKFETFNQLFNFGHYYFGFLDLVGRQNIRDVSGQVAMYPMPWITLLGQVHHFELDSAKAGLFNAAGVLTRSDPTGQAGTHVGEEIDLLVNFHIDMHQDLLIGWSKLFPGRFLEQTGSGASPELVYVQYQFRW
jgi:hypothetical protein